MSKNLTRRALLMSGVGFLLDAALPCLGRDRLNDIKIGCAFAAEEDKLADVARNVDYVFGSFSLLPGVVCSAPVNFRQDRNKLANPKENQHDRRWYQDNHPDWLVYKLDRKTLASDNDGRDDAALTIDISNPQVQQYQFDHLVEPWIRKGFKRVAFDSTDLENHADHWAGVYRNGTWVQLYSGTERDAAYAKAVLGWAQTMRALIQHKYPDVQIDVNHSLRQGMEAEWHLLLPHIDGIFDEKGFTTWGKNFSVDRDWDKQIACCETAVSQGKLYFCNNYVNVPDTGEGASTSEMRALARRLDATVPDSAVVWALANYLLFAGDKSFVNVSASFNRIRANGTKQHMAATGVYFDRSLYHVPLGSPSGSRQQLGEIAYRRFKNGIVLVNPSSSTIARASLPGVFKDRHGQTKLTAELQPSSAAIYFG